VSPPVTRVIVSSVKQSPSWRAHFGGLRGCARNDGGLATTREHVALYRFQALVVTNVFRIPTDRSGDGCTRIRPKEKEFYLSRRGSYNAAIIGSA
jgi:hypothetical protein